MSEVISNEQQEQNQTENQQQNIEVPTNNQSESHQQPTEQRQEQKKPLTIETNLEQPTSPNNVKLSETIENVSSPRADGSQKVIKSQSPGLLKGKLDVLRNLYTQKLDELNSIDKSGVQKQKKLQMFRKVLEAAKKNEAEKVQQASQQMSLKNQTISELESKLNNLKSSNISQSHSERVAQIKANILKASQDIERKQNQLRRELLEAKNAERINALSQNAQSLRRRKQQILSSVNQNQSKLNDGRNNLESILNNLISTTKSNNSSKIVELQNQYNNLAHEIQQKKQLISQLQTQIDSVKNSQVASNQSQTPDISGLKYVVEEAKNTKARLQKQVEALQKQFKEVANKIKSNESTIENRKAKTNQLNEKNKKLQEQKNKLEKQVGEGKKKPKFEQKIPEQLLVLRTKKAALQKQVKQEIERTEKERNKQDNLVPASVIETMKAKITEVKQQNDRYGKLIVQNGKLREENKNLDVTKDGLEWETSAEYKIVAANVEKQQAKHDALDKQIAQIRNKNIHLSNKLEEYANQYPDFNPEKKLKKPEPVQVKSQAKPQPKKQTQQPAEEKPTNKKKGTKTSPQVSQTIVPEVIEEKASPLTQSPKQQPKSGKNKNKSKKSKQTQEDKVVEKKEELVKKEEPAPKVEIIKKEEPVKKQEVKVENKPTQSGQGNKNKKKR